MLRAGISKNARCASAGVTAGAVVAALPVSTNEPPVAADERRKSRRFIGEEVSYRPFFDEAGLTTEDKTNDVKRVARFLLIKNIRPIETWALRCKRGLDPMSNSVDFPPAVYSTLPFQTPVNWRRLSLVTLLSPFATFAQVAPTNTKTSVDADRTVLEPFAVVADKIDTYEALNFSPRSGANRPRRTDPQKAIWTNTFSF